ncbi:MAG: hypothetical protein RL398_1295 [Planctomycetota bacterium]
MTDFGANIFDDSTPPADGGGKKGKRKPTRAKRAAEPEAAPEGSTGAVAEQPPQAAPAVADQPSASEAAPAARKSSPRKPRSRAKAAASDAQSAPSPGEADTPRQPPAQPLVTEVPVTAPQWVHDDLQAVTFGGSAEAPTVVAAPDDAPAAPTAEQPPADRGDRHEHRQEHRHEHREHRREHREHRREHREERRETREERRQGRGHRDGTGPGHDLREEHRETEPQPGQRRPETVTERPRQTAVGLLVDMVALAEEARQQGGELALTRLARGLAGERRIATALSFQAGKRAPVGFVAEPADAPDAPARLRHAAEDLARQGTALVLAPATDAMLDLARQLRALGAKVELAGFVVRDDGGNDTLRLPRGCIFIP